MKILLLYPTEGGEGSGSHQPMNGSTALRSRLCSKLGSELYLTLSVQFPSPLPQNPAWYLGRPRHQLIPWLAHHRWFPVSSWNLTLRCVCLFCPLVWSSLSLSPFDSVLCLQRSLPGHCPLPIQQLYFKLSKSPSKKTKVVALLCHLKMQDFLVVCTSLCLSSSFTHSVALTYLFNSIPTHS